MKKNYLVYKLADGYINDWLVLGPCQTPITEQPQPGESSRAFRTRVLAATDHTTPDYATAPVEIDKITSGDKDFFWEIEHLKDDHLLERASFLPVYTLAHVWAFTRVNCAGAKAVTLNVTATSPVSVWVNGRHVTYGDRMTEISDQTAQTYTFPVGLRPGSNDLMIRLEQVAAGDSVMALAVRLQDVPLDTVKILVPTVTGDPKRRQEWETAFSYTYLSQSVYSRDDTIKLMCSDDMPEELKAVARLQKLDDSIYAEVFGDLKAGAVIEGVYGVQLPLGPMKATLMPPAESYYDNRFRAKYTLPFANSNAVYSTEAAGEYEERLIITMQEAQRSDDKLYAEIAKMALGWWEVLDVREIRTVLGQIKRAEAQCLPDLVGLAGMQVRMAHYEKFPADLRPEIEECLTAFDYAAQGIFAPDMTLEYNQIALYAARILAGQAFPKATFTASGLSGKQERSRGEKLAEAWLRQHAQTGFAQWNSRTDLIIAALAHLADLAESETTCELAAVLLDKLVFGLAINSFQGTFGAVRADARAAWMRSGRFAPEAALNSLLWGTGNHNTYFKGAVSLALAGHNYELPEIIHTIGMDPRPEALTREQQQVSDSDRVNIVTYKTPDFMLSSAQDYHAGQTGRREHIWQATMGPDALVFSNHPGSCSESDARQKGWWCGNGKLPRVAQWNNALIAVYNLGDSDPLGFTHAYFPAFAFDEHALEQGWAFARKGDAYLALYAEQGMKMNEVGADAHCALRSDGLRNVWLCQMGRKEVDGSYEEFCQKVLAKAVTINDLDVAWETARGDKLHFAWSGPLSVNGKDEAISGFKNVDSPYALAEFPAETMDIGIGEQIMRLHLT